jgi:hypothetical protein
MSTITRPNTHLSLTIASFLAADLVMRKVMVEEWIKWRSSGDWMKMIGSIYIISSIVFRPTNIRELFHISLDYVFDSHSSLF